MVCQIVASSDGKLPVSRSALPPSLFSSGKDGGGGNVSSLTVTTTRNGGSSLSCARPSTTLAYSSPPNIWRRCRRPLPHPLRTEDIASLVNVGGVRTAAANGAGARGLVEDDSRHRTMVSRCLP